MLVAAAVLVPIIQRVMEALLPPISAHFTRQLSKVRYTLRDCYLSAVALFFVQDRSLLQFQRRFQRKFQANNLSSTFGVSRIPCDSQFRDLIDRHDYAPILPCFADFIGRLQRFKWLQH